MVENQHNDWSDLSDFKFNSVRLFSNLLIVQEESKLKLIFAGEILCIRHRVEECFSLKRIFSYRCRTILLTETYTFTGTIITHQLH